MAYQGIGPSDWFGVIHYGYEYGVSDAFVAAGDALDVDLMDLGNDEVAALVQEGSLSSNFQAEHSLANLLSRGGMDSMLWTVNLIICAMCFGGVMDSSGMLATMAEGLIKLAKGTGSLVTITVFSCIFMNIIASDQYLAIILPGRMYKEAFEDKRLKPKNLSRVLEDAGTMTSSLIPWNTCGATMATFLGVPTLAYLPYTVLNYVNPLVSIFYGFTGISMQKMSEEEYQKLLIEREAESKAAEEALL